MEFFGGSISLWSGSGSADPFGEITDPAQNPDPVLDR